MAGAWRGLVLVVGLAAVACVAKRRHLRYDDIVILALRYFNQGQQGQPLFRLLEATPPPPSSNNTLRIPLNFRIKETVCILNGRRRPRECAFKEGGEERTCTGTFLVRRRGIFEVDCVPDLENQTRPESDLENQPGPESHLKNQPRPESDVPLLKSSASTSEGDPLGDERSKSSVANNLYERAKYDVIANILKNI